MIDPKQQTVTTREKEEQEQHDTLLVQELEELLADHEDYKW